MKIHTGKVEKSFTEERIWRVQDEAEIRSASIEVNRLAFRMSRAFMRKLGGMQFQSVRIEIFVGRCVSA